MTPDQQKAFDSLQAEVAVLRIFTASLLEQAIGKTAIKSEANRILPLLIAAHPEQEQQLRKYMMGMLEHLA